MIGDRYELSLFVESWAGPAAAAATIRTIVTDDGYVMYVPGSLGAALLPGEHKVMVRGERPVACEVVLQVETLADVDGDEIINRVIRTLHAAGRKCLGAQADRVPVCRS